MKNLEQIRAAAALGPAEKLDKAAVNKLPAMILTNGLLATLAFCSSEGGGKNRPDMVVALEATGMHLAELGLLRRSSEKLGDIMRELVARDSSHLQRVTAETLAFIGYLRRFAKTKKANRAGGD